MGRLFGTDGVRGIANSELTPEMAFNLGKAGAYVLGSEKDHPTIVIGKDTRVSGDMLENALTAGILAVGGNVIKVGVIPTPAVAYLVKHYEAQAGIVISASHNPYEYNGIKFFNSKGFKLDDEVEEKIEDIIIRGIEVNPHLSGDGIGTCMEAEETATELYIRYLLSTVEERFDGMTIVMDCANGASYKTAPRVYEELGAKVITIGVSPNGININDQIGSTHPEALQARVIEENADVGLAYDGDADRLIVVDELGRVVNGDKTICICAKMLKDSGKLKENKVTATVMSNIGFHKYVEAMGATVDVTDVGDRYVLESMLKTGCVIGGEQSGHIIFLDRSTTGDGAVSSLQFMTALKKSGKKASELAEEVVLYPQVLVNARVDNKNKESFREDVEIVERISDIEAKLEGEGRVLIRPSGTEPLVRVMIEGKDEEKIAEMAEDLAAIISKKFS